MQNRKLSGLVINGAINELKIIWNWFLGIMNLSWIELNQIKSV